jgi:HD-GYP domain-containing protein (c-di-GMP phosphodiesterase class II)
MEHPFPLGHFRIATQEQLDTLHGLGLETVRVLPERSDPQAMAALVQEGVLASWAGHPAGLDPQPAQDCALADLPSGDEVGVGGAASLRAPAPSTSSALAGAQAADSTDSRAQRLRALKQERSLALQAEREHADAGRSLRRSFELLASRPEAARELCEQQVQLFLDKLQGTEEMAIRLLSESAGDRGALHAVNVTVLSLLLGRQLAMSPSEMFDLGVGALLHDVGKIELPERVRWLDPVSPQMLAHERHAYQEHVTHGTRLGRQMGLTDGALRILAQHHELADGSGFPLRLSAAQMSVPASVVSLINRYDKLCNPATPSQALTPHEALALMYAQTQSQFDARVFGAFVKMMGVYPPGSVVQLTDGRYAMVISANIARPLRPRVRVHDAHGAPEDAAPLDLQDQPDLGIRRSLKPQQLPRAALADLSPRVRICYFFERAREAAPAALEAAR